MKHVKRGMLVGMLSSMLTVLLLTAGEASAASLSCGTWSVVKSANTGTSYNVLLGVAAVSASDIWAVGYNGNYLRPGHALTEHWNGTRWSVVSSPNVGTSDNLLLGVAAISANNIWAVGFYQNIDVATRHQLMEHWNGTSWSVVMSPSFGTLSNALYGIAAISASDIWAVGYYVTHGGIFKSLVEHWNGTKWSVVSSPNPNLFDNILSGVAAVSATNVWAVGDRSTTTLIEHWNGTGWSVAPSPNVGTDANYLNSVAAVSANNLWSVGFYVSARKGLETLIEQWNGSSWNVVQSPSPGPSENYLNGVAAISAMNVWAVGDYITHSGFYATLIEHWNGTRWSVVPSPSPGTQYNELHGVTTVSNTLWTVGERTNGDGRGYQTLTEFYC